MSGTFDALWSDLEPIGREASSGGYRRFAWTPEDAALREWFAGQAAARGLDLVLDRAGNQWAWWGDPDAAVRARRPGVVIGSHLDSVPDGGAFDGPLGVVSALAVIDQLRAGGARPARPIGVVNFGDEEGARFGIACAGSRLITGALAAGRALGLRDERGLSMAEAMTAAGHGVRHLGRDDEALGRVGCFVELHVEQGRALSDGSRSPSAPVGVGSSIWPHGRWRFELTGEANHAGTTALVDRHDPMIDYAHAVLAARRLAEQHGVLATCGKVAVTPNGVNAVPSRVTGWLDARGPEATAVQAMVAELSAELAQLTDGLATPVIEESWTPLTAFDADLAARASTWLGGAPVIATGAGHDAGILAGAGIAAAMLFVRNPTGVSHSPAEHAERDDCLAGIQALATVVRELSR